MSLQPLAPNYGALTPQLAAMQVGYDSTGTAYANVASLAGNSPTVQPAFNTTLDYGTPIKPPQNQQAKFVVKSVIVTNVSAGALGGTTTFSAGWATTATATPGALAISASTAIQSLAAGASYSFDLSSAAATNWTSSSTNDYFNVATPVAAGASTALKIDVIGYFQAVGV